MITGAQPLRRQGFTLIELVLALAIAGIVLTAINSVFFAALKLRNETVRVAEQTMPVERALATIKRDLVGIVPPGTLAGIMGTDATMIGVTQPLIVEIYTTTGVLSDDVPWADVQKVDYWLQDPTNRNSGAVGKDLMRGVTRNLLASSPVAPDAQRIIGGVQSFRLSYFDATNWNDAWSTSLSNTPVAIKGFLTFATPKTGSPPSPPIQFVVPVVIESSTNSSLTNSTGTNSTSATSSSGTSTKASN